MKLHNISGWVVCSAWALTALSANALAGTADANVYLGLDETYFPDTGLIGGQGSTYTSFTAFAESNYDSDDGDWRVATTLFGRKDARGGGRSHLDARELYIWHNFGSFEAYAGLRKVFWGVTESVHLVDIINQTDTLENIDGEDKLGQPTLQIVSTNSWGTAQLFVLPYFREREYPDGESRLRPLLPVIEDAHFQSGDGNNHIDYALRWSHYFGALDLGLSHFHGTSREPIFNPIISPSGAMSLLPMYQQIDQTGLDLQTTVDAWLLKSELISVDERGYGRSTAFAGGIEYTFFAMGGSHSDLGLIAEYQFDDRVGIREKTTQNDVALGFRWALNDMDNSSLLLIATHDLDYHNNFLSVEGSHRLNDKWTLDLELRVFDSAKPGMVEYAFEADDYLKFELRRYF